MLSVSADALAKSRGRWLAFAAIVVVSGAMLYAQHTEHHCCVKTAPPAAPVAAPEGVTPRPRGASRWSARRVESTR